MTVGASAWDIPSTAGPAANAQLPNSLIFTDAFGRQKGDSSKLSYNESTKALVFGDVSLLSVVNSGVERLRMDSSGSWTLGGPVGAQSLKVTSVANATRWIEVIGSNGGSPVIRTSAGAMQLGDGSVQTAAAAESTGAIALDLIGRSADNIAILRFVNYLYNVVHGQMSSSASGHLSFTTASGGADAGTQLQIIHVPNATRAVWVSGSTVSPKIFTSAGFLDIGSPVLFTAQNVGTTVGAAGGAAALPATPLGYLSTFINGTACRIPYYN